MRRELALSTRIILALLAGAALLPAIGCGGGGKEVVGTWALDTSDLGLQPSQGQYSLTWTFREGGSGSMTVEQTLHPDMPATQTTRFAWEVKGDKLVMSAGDEAAEYEYEFSEDGDLLLTLGGQPALRLRRVQ